MRKISAELLPIAIVTSYASVVLCLALGHSPDVVVRHGDDIIASSTCGVMYVADPGRATRADFQVLLQNTRKVCEKKPGTRKSWHSDGPVNYVMLINEETCVINWELSQVTAFRAYEEVCLNRK